MDRMTEPSSSRLAGESDAAGAAMSEAESSPVPLHYGDPGEEFEAATRGAGVTDRSDRVRFEMSGRAPGQMLNGVVSGAVPTPPAPSDAGVLSGRASYSAVLTPKGRMVTDLRLFARPGNEERYLLDVPSAGARGLAEHLTRYVPPRLARIEDVSAGTAMITVLGPSSSESLARTMARVSEGGAVAPGDPGSLRAMLDALEELDYLEVGGFTIVRSRDVSVPAFDVIGGRSGVRAFWRDLRVGNVRPLGRRVWQALRVEAGRPEFGTDMNAETLPPEAGIENSAIDHAKGCYTGQEVIVRIRDRGHVNRRLRGLLFNGEEAPAPGTELYEPGEVRPRGYVTSAVVSPRSGRAIGLGYVRREVEPPAELRLGAPEGPPVRVAALTRETWPA